MVIHKETTEQFYSLLTEYYLTELTPFIEHQYARNDPAHQLDHAVTVAKEAASLLLWCSRNDIPGAPTSRSELYGHLELTMIAALYHDIFTGQHRATHHELIHKYIMETTHYPLCLPDCERVLVADACLQHRASWKGGYSSIISEVVAAADRGNPEPEHYFLRSVIYGHHHGKDWLDALIHGFSHIGEKFGGGKRILAVPEWYHVRYAAEIERASTIFRLADETLHTRENVLEFAREHFPMDGVLWTWIRSKQPA